MNDFDRIAGVYDRLKRIIFGNRLDEAAEWFLDEITKTDRVLVLGGGTGKLLDQLPRECEIVYVEKSKRMLAYARKHDNRNTQFIHSAFEALQPDQFDWVICPYFLDVFEEEQLPMVIEKIRCCLLPEGRLLITDFSAGKTTHQLLLNLMYLFFRITTKIQAARLTDLRQAPISFGLEEVNYRSFSDGLIFSGIYQKQETF